MKESSRFYSSLSLLVLLNAIIKPLWIFGIDRQVQNELGTAVYGTFFSIWNLSYVLIFMLDWGLTVFYNRQLSIKTTNETTQAGSFVFLKLLFALVYSIIIALIALFTGISRWDILFYVIVIQVLSSMLIFFRAIITSQQWFSTDAWISVLDKLLMIIFGGILLYFPTVLGPMSLTIFLQLLIGSLGFTILVALAVLLLRKFHFTFRKLWPGKHVFRSALPFAIIVLLMSFHARIDGFLLERIGNATEAGKYAAAYRLLDASNTLGFLFASFLLPYVTRLWSEGRDFGSVVLNIRHLLLMAAVTLGAVVLIFAPWLQRILYHHFDRDSIDIMRWCLPALIGYYLNQVYGTVMTATGHIVAYSYITFFSVVINLIINFLLIPSMGAKGSCIAALISQVCCGIGTVWYVKQKLSVPVDLRSVIIYIFTGALIAGLLYAGADLPVSKWLMIMFAGIIAMAIMWFTRLIDMKALRTSALH